MGSRDVNVETPDGIMPYWHVNVPEHLRTAECPDFLANLGQRDFDIITTPDSDYEMDTWAVVLQKVAQNRLELFQRKPSDLRRYIGFTWKLRRDYGSVMNFILSERLRWELPIVPKGEKPFELEEDIKVLRNDWPYGIDQRIVHLVIWTKFPLVEDPATGDLTDQARGEIDEYVRKKFGCLDQNKVGSKA